MDKATFEHEMNRGQTFQKLETDRAEYWTGYQRGLRRAYHGESFGTAEEHALWLGLQITTGTTLYGGRGGKDTGTGWRGNAGRLRAIARRTAGIAGRVPL